MSFTIENQTKSKIPKIDFEGIKTASLGADFDLNLVICGPAEIQKLNLIYRDINKATDILSFPLSENEGEILICPEEAKKEAVKFERSYENFFAFLFVHGCAHLKGFDHGRKMELFEAKIRRRFKI